MRSQETEGWLKVHGYSDASFASDGSRSRSGHVVFVGDGVCCWNSSRQTSAASAVSESELVAIHGCSLVVTWINRLVCQWMSRKMCDNRSVLCVPIGTDSAVALRQLKTGNVSAR
eukprot:6440105-Amphidinium_carterae.1